METRAYLKGTRLSPQKAALVAVEKNPESFEANFSAGQILGRAGASSSEILVSFKIFSSSDIRDSIS